MTDLASADQIVFAQSHSCALFGGAVQCRGEDGYGQPGDGSAISSTSSLVPVAGALDAAWLHAGNQYTCALTTASELLCWGSGDELGFATPRRTPIRIVGLP